MKKVFEVVNNIGSIASIISLIGWIAEKIFQ